MFRRLFFSVYRTKLIMNRYLHLQRQCWWLARHRIVSVIKHFCTIISINLIKCSLRTIFARVSLKSELTHTRTHIGIQFNIDKLTCVPYILMVDYYLLAMRLSVPFNPFCKVFHLPRTNCCCCYCHPIILNATQ